MYAKIVIFFIKFVKNDLKNFRRGKCFNFFTILQKLCEVKTLRSVLRSKKFYMILAKMCIKKFFHNLLPYLFVPISLK